MKKVIIKQEEEKVYLSDLDSSSLVGLELNQGLKAFLLYSCEKGFYCVNNTDFSKLESKVFEYTIKGCIEKMNVKNVFVFETHKELFKWMSE